RQRARRAVLVFEHGPGELAAREVRLDEEARGLGEQGGAARGEGVHVADDLDADGRAARLGLEHERESELGGDGAPARRLVALDDAVARDGEPGEAEELLRARLVEPVRRRLDARAVVADPEELERALD